ncbi:MAG TPA: hypothetical protein VFO19_02985 [Vicinamibacterales bacterium]|nr:hypothetical protein [Vicinamibacterales bacterium]
MASRLLHERAVLTGRVVRAALVVLSIAVVGLATSLTGFAPKFRSDDPLAREPETQDASKAEPADISLMADLLLTLFTKPAGVIENRRAGNVNTIDEVPDSSWFTNRIYAKPVSAAELERGPNVLEGPAPGRWTVVAPKRGGTAPGFRIRDSRGEVWFLSFDPRGVPNAATAAIAIATKIFWALGYNQVESHLATIRLEDLDVAETAKIELRPDRERPMTLADVESVLRRAARNPDGSYRVLAARALPGRVLGGFRFYGTRPDDPNDIVPHEHRRELRALKVFGAWANLVDMKALNTLDVLVPENGKSVIRHYLQDVGSTFGAGSQGPHGWEEGYEYLYEGGPLWKRMLTLGFYMRPWQTEPIVTHPEIGRVQGEGFDPEGWKPRTPIAAVEAARADDTFWAALRVQAFTDDLIRTVVKQGRLSDPKAEELLANVLIERRNAIVRTYLPKITPLVRFALDDAGTLTFENAAVRAGVANAPANGYRAEWSNFNNDTEAAASLGAATTSQTERFTAPAGLSRTAGAIVKVAISADDPAQPTWSKPVDVYFRRTASGWQLVGVERSVD